MANSITPEQLMEGYEEFAAAHAPTPSPSENPEGLFGRTMKHLGNLPVNVPQALVGGVQGLMNAGLSPADQFETTQIPKIFDIAAPTTSGEAWTDAIAGHMLPDVAAALIPYAGITKASRVLNAGKTVEEIHRAAKIADIVGQAASGGLIGAQYGPDEAVRQALTGGALAGLGQIPSRMDRILPAAGVAAADAAVAYHMADDPNKQAAAGSAFGMDLLFALLPGNWHRLPDGKVQYRPGNAEMYDGPLHPAGMMADRPLNPAGMMYDGPLNPAGSMADGPLSPGAMDIGAFLRSQQGEAMLDPRLAALRNQPIDLRKPNPNIRQYDPMGINPRPEVVEPGISEMRAISAPEELLNLGAKAKKKKTALHLAPDAELTPASPDVPVTTIQPSLELSAELAGLPIGIREHLTAAVDQIDNVDDALLEQLRNGIRTVTAQLKENEFALLQNQNPEGLVLPWAANDGPPSSIITGDVVPPSPSELFGRSLIEDPTAPANLPVEIIPGEAPIGSGARTQNYKGVQQALRSKGLRQEPAPIEPPPVGHIANEADVIPNRPVFENLPPRQINESLEGGAPASELRPGSARYFLTSKGKSKAMNDAVEKIEIGPDGKELPAKLIYRAKSQKEAKALRDKLNTELQEKGLYLDPEVHLKAISSQPKKPVGEYTDPQGLIQQTQKSKLHQLPESKRTEGGFISPEALISAVQPVAGGAIGGMIGDTPEERIQNALAGFVLGAGTGAATHARLANPKVAASKTGGIANPFHEGLPNGMKVDIAEKNGSVRMTLHDDVRELGHLNAYQHGDDLRIEFAGLKPELQGQKIGLHLYDKMADEAAARGLNLTSDTSVSAEAARVYEALAKRGYRIEKNPNAYMLEDRGQQHWVSHDSKPIFKVYPPDQVGNNANQGLKPLNNTRGFISTHAATTGAGAIAGGLYGYSEGEGDMGTTLAFASLGALAGYSGFKVLEAVSKINPKLHIDEPVATAKSVKEHTKSNIEKILSTPARDLAGREVRGRGGVAEKFLRGMEHWGRLHMPAEIKTAWTQARGAGALVVETVMDSLNQLRWRHTVSDDIRNIANKFIDGQMLDKTAVENYVKSQGGLEHAEWKKLTKAEKAKYRSWLHGDRNGKASDLKIYHLPEKARRDLMDLEAEAFKKAVGDRDPQYVDFMITARRGVDTLQDMLAEGMPESKLKELIINSTGQYVTRTYKIFTDPHYRPTDTQIEAAMKEASSFLQASTVAKHLKGGKIIEEEVYNNAKLSLEKSKRPEAAGRLDALNKMQQREVMLKLEDGTVKPSKVWFAQEAYDELDKFTNDDFMRVFVEDYVHQIKTGREIFHIGNRNTIDTTLLKERENISPTFRELLGEYRDPKERMLQTINRIYPSAQASRFISKLADMEVDGLPAVLDDIDWNKRSLDLQEKLAGAKSDAKKADIQSQIDKLNAYVNIPKNLKYGMLKDSKVSRFVADQLQAYQGPWGVWEAPIGRGFAKVNTVAKMIRAPYNPVVHIRNIVTMPFFAAIGKAEPSALLQTFKALQKRDDLYRELLEQGIITADQTRSEFREVFDNVFSGHYDSDVSSLLYKGHRKILDAYRYPDAVVRGGTYLSAKSRYAKELGLPETHPDVIRKAVEWTDRRTMNYDNIAPAVVTARNLPFFNMFISYAAEMARLVKNLAQDGVKGDVSALAILGGLAVVPELMQKASESALSEKDQQEWARVQALSPAYNRNRYKIVTGKDSKGNFKYIDFTPWLITDNFNRTIKSAIQGDSEAVWAANPVFGWENTPAFNIIAEQVAGRDLRTQRKFREDSPDRILAVAEELMPVWTPGIGYEWKKDMPEALGGKLGVENLKTGRKDDISTILLKFTTGLNKTTLNAASLQRSAMARAKSDIANERAYLNDVLKSSHSEKVKERAVERYKRAVQMIIANYTDRLQ